MIPTSTTVASDGTNLGSFLRSGRISDVPRVISNINTIASDRDLPGN